MQSFSTQDRQLALALLTAGCRFAPQFDQDGAPVGPAANIYTPDCLRAKKLLPPKRPDGGSDTTIPQFEAAARKAWEHKIPGIVVYIFERDDTLEQALAAWDRMVAEVAAARKAGRDPVAPPVSAAVVMQVMYARRITEQHLRDNDPTWVHVPLCKIESSSTSTEPLPGAPSIPGAPRLERRNGTAKIWSLNISQENRKKLGI